LAKTKKCPRKRKNYKKSKQKHQKKLGKMAWIVRKKIIPVKKLNKTKK